MDLSKLPGRAPPPGDAPPTGPKVPESPKPTPAVMVEPVPAGGRAVQDDGDGWDGYFPLGIGVLVLLLYPNVVMWLAGKGPVITDTATGAPVPYPKSIFFQGDLAITLFGAALIVEGLALMFARRSLVAVFAAAWVMTLATTYNAYHLVTNPMPGLPIFSVLAVLFGVYAAVQLFRRARGMRG